MKRFAIAVMTVACLAIMLVSCAKQPVQADTSSPVEMTSDQSPWRYTRYNTHYFRRGTSLRASCINYVGSGMFLPYNTKCLIGEWNRGFTLQPQDKDLVIYFEYSPKYMGGLPLLDYLDLITSEKSVSYPGLSNMGLKGIQIGQAQTWMTKEGIKIALGYPARHKTPLLEASKWYYWKNRMVAMSIEFDESGKVIKIR